MVRTIFSSHHTTILRSHTKANNMRKRALTISLLLVVNVSMCFQPDQGTHLPTFCFRIPPHLPSRVTLLNNINDDGESEPEFEPLDVILERARKRGANPIVKVQVFCDRPILTSLRWLTRGDVIFAFLAFLIGSKGFVFGLLTGKWTLSVGLLPRKMNLPPLIVQLYPVLLAIAFDQLF